MTQGIVDYPGHILHGKRVHVHHYGDCHGVPMAYVTSISFIEPDGITPSIFGLPADKVRVLAATEDAI